MTQFVRIEARISDRDELKQVAMELTGLATRIALIAYKKDMDDEAAIMLARDRIKTASQRMRKGLKNAD